MKALLSWATCFSMLFLFSIAATGADRANADPGQAIGTLLSQEAVALPVIVPATATSAELSVNVETTAILFGPIDTAVLPAATSPPTSASSADYGLYMIGANRIWYGPAPAETARSGT